MNTKPQKQQSKSIKEIQQKFNKSKKHKNLYNINISFNINNPKKVISNQINKTFKVNHYSIAPQDNLNKNKKLNFSKILNPSAKSHSTSLSKSKDFNNKSQCIKQFSKYECYLQNQLGNKKHKRSRNKGYDIENRSKSDFTYNTSILNMPFPGNDPLPDAAVKRLNKMKKYFLQKIGSMDITMPQDDLQQITQIMNENNHQSQQCIKQYQYNNQHNNQNKNQYKNKNKNEYKRQKQDNKQQQDDIMTQKLSQYQYENLISYQNQRNSSALRSKQLYDYQMTQTFPHIVIDNSLSIKNQYLRHHSKFLSQNQNLFINQNIHSYNKKYKQKQKNKKGKLSFDMFQTQIKSKLLNPFDSSFINHNHNNKYKNKDKNKNNKHSKQFKSTHLFSNHNKSNQTNGLKQKIKIIQDFLLKSDSSQSILKIGNRNNQQNPTNKLQTKSKIQDLYKKDIKKQYIIKTQVQLPKNLINQIKQFQSHTLPNNQIQKPLLQKNNFDQQKNIQLQKNSIQNISYLQFLSNRDEQSQKKQTQQLIQNYIDILSEHLSLEEQIKKIGNQGFQQEMPLGLEIQYTSEEKSKSLKKQKQQNSNDKQEQQEKQLNRVSSQVSSYVYGQDEKNDSQSQIHYSQSRNQKISLQKQMRQDLAKRLSLQFQQKNNHYQVQEESSMKIITNSNSLEHSIKENNSDLQYRKKTEDISEIQKSINLFENTNNYQENIVESPHDDINKQVDKLLGFIKKNINFQNADRQVLKDLYEKLVDLSARQISVNDNQSSPLKSSQPSIMNLYVENSSPIILQKPVQTPKKPQQHIQKSNNHKRSYSTMKDNNKNLSNFVSSDDLNLWDLIIVEQRLNKKYNQITYEKQKQLFQIQTDLALSESQCQQKISQLGRWQNINKRQILNTKKEIKNGIQNLRKIIPSENNSFSFKMKSFSQKSLIPKFCIKTFYQQKNQQINYFPSQIKNKKQQSEKQEQKKQSDKINKQKSTYRYDPQNLDLQNEVLVPKLSVNLDTIFIQQSQNFSDKTDSQHLKQSQQLSQNLSRQKLSQVKLLQKSNQSKQSKNQKQQSEQQDQPNQIPRIQLFRTSKNKSNNSNQDQQTQSLGSQQSLDSQQVYNNQKVYEYKQNEDEKQQFIDLLKIQKYKLGNLNQLSDDQLNHSLQDFINKDNNLYIKTKQQIKLIQDYKITQDDKIDICQFILLDLCIQLYQETLDLEDSQIKKGNYKNASAHRIMNDLFNFIKKQKKKPKKKGPKIGIFTQLHTVKQYVQKIKLYIESLQEKSKKKPQQPNEHNNKQLIIHRINSPIGPTASQILKTMRFYEDQTFTYKQEDVSPEFAQNEGLNSLILPVYAFTDFEQKLQNDKQFVFDTYFQDAQKQKNRLAFLKNVTHVHHKAIFDALNQMLDFQRPFGIWGKPFPWKKKNDRQKQLSQSDLKVSLKNSCNKVLQCAMYMCGLLVDKQQSLIKNTAVSEAYIDEVKEDRMSKMIINDFLQNQTRFYFLDDEETQILLQTSYVIWLLLIQEALKQFDIIYKRKM